MVKVTFGDPNMEIKRDDPNRRRILEQDRKSIADYIYGKDIAKILNMSEDFEEARKDIKINQASLKGNDSIRIQATSGMTTQSKLKK